MVDLARILFDFGLVVLTWIVQLVIYPGFRFYSREEMDQWHPVYTIRITYVVLPLMFGQLILHALNTWTNPGIFPLINFMLVIGMWVITFVWAVPLHQKADRGQDLEGVVNDLNRVHTYRTIGWTTIFIISLYTFL